MGDFCENCVSPMPFEPFLRVPVSDKEVFDVPQIGMSCRCRAIRGWRCRHAATGSLTDPKGDFPDIVKLSYGNGSSKVTMKMTYAGARPQNESFYLKWGTTGKRYQVFDSPSAGIRELRYYRAKNASPKRIDCRGLRVTQPSASSTKVVIPRGCLTKAADKLRFQGIATEGLMSSDETKVSKAVVRG